MEREYYIAICLHVVMVCVVYFDMAGGKGVLHCHLHIFLVNMRLFYYSPLHLSLFFITSA